MGATSWKFKSSYLHHSNLVNDLFARFFVCSESVLMFRGDLVWRISFGEVVYRAYKIRGCFIWTYCGGQVAPLSVRVEKSDSLSLSDFVRGHNSRIPNDTVVYFGTRSYKLVCPRTV